jgi:hypothetical protein
MAQTCSKCSRVNPAEALYCYYDGDVLGVHPHDSGPVNSGAQPFPNPFVFPSGQVCRNFDQLALACLEQWPAAVELLRQGDLVSFLQGLGRADLAQAAREGARFPDADRGLDLLLGRLPTGVLEPARLRVEPCDLNLGLLRVGEDRLVELRLVNQGMRLLYGSVACADGVWLGLGDGPGGPGKLFQFWHELVLPVHVRGRHLHASSRPQEARLVVESNGGTATVVVHAEVPIRPFTEGVLAGARSPRQLAEKAKALPSEAAALFESRAVADWYKVNGWTYPVQGPPATGVGAVQQFFEALGLTPPPRVEISEPAVVLHGNVGDRLGYRLKVLSPEKRPVYAHATCNRPWLEVGRVRQNGSSATIPLAVPAVPDRVGETLTAQVTVTANGRQKFVVPVTLEVGWQFRPASTAASQAAPGSPALPAPRRPRQQVVKPASGGWSRPFRQPVGRGLHAVPAVALIVVLGLLILYEALMPATGPDAGPWWRHRTGPMVRDSEPRIAVQFSDTMRFGIIMLKETDPANPDKRKRLTFDEAGGSNNTCIRIDGHENLFGRPPGAWARSPRGKQPLKLLEDEEKRGRKWASVWEYEEGVRVTQTVEIVPGEQTGVYDTCLVEYEIDNRSTAPHKVGLRVMLDTFIGANDGVPFVIPGQPGLLETVRHFPQKEIPDFIQALERSDLRDPGTIAQMGLKLSGVEPIESLLICRWPDNSERRWSWPPAAMNDPPERKDSCVTLYWAEQEMAPQSKRQMAFTYGLGSLSSVGSGNTQLSLTTGGSFQPGGVFTVTAYVKNPQEGQKVALELPRGLTLVEGPAEQSVSASGTDYSQVSWRVRAGAVGDYTLAVVSPPAREQGTVRINRGSLFR